MNDAQKISLSVYGAPHSNYDKSFDVLEKAQELGEIIAKHDCILTIPATTGLSLIHI